jgi:hypothetical protein
MESERSWCMIHSGIAQASTLSNFKNVHLIVHLLKRTSVRIQATWPSEWPWDPSLTRLTYRCEDLPLLCTASRWLSRCSYKPLPVEARDGCASLDIKHLASSLSTHESVTMHGCKRLEILSRVCTGYQTPGKCSLQSPKDGDLDNQHMFSRCGGKQSMPPTLFFFCDIHEVVNTLTHA